MYDDWMNAKRVAVLGAGTMGSGIAAHLANLGFDVMLFDVSKEAARAGLDRAIAIKPPHFCDHESVTRVTPLSIENDVSSLGGADWICEAVVEKSHVKRDLFRSIEPLLRYDAMITTNTSGLEIRLLAEGMSESFRKRFIGTHFFNPPRYLKLLELIPTADTDKAAIQAYVRFLEDRVGKRVVIAKDTPGFIANRFGMWCLFQAIHACEKLHFSVETVDAITGPFIGRPKTATFRLADLIGLDIMRDVAQNIQSRCEHDKARNILNLPKSVSDLLASGRTGSKSGRGYYEQAGKDFLVYDFGDGRYRAQQPLSFPSIEELQRKPIGERIRIAMTKRDEVGEFLRAHIPPILEYAAHLGPEIAHNVLDVDRVMKWGFGWECGPFELIDRIGYELLEAYWTSTPLKQKSPFYLDTAPLSFAQQRHLPHQDHPSFATVTSFKAIDTHDEWIVRQDGAEGIIFEFRTKMNALTAKLVSALTSLLRQHPGVRITLANEGRGFSAGFDLISFLRATEEKRFDEIEGWLRDLQECSLLLREAPSVAAAHGFTLGGGMEFAMHCQKTVSTADATLGLPEALVGLVPAGGGTALMRHRSQGDGKLMAQAFVTLASGAKVAGCVAKKSLLLREADLVVANPDQLVTTAINSKPEPLPPAVWLPAPPQAKGMIDQELEKLRQTGAIGEYGATIAEEIKRIFTKPESYEQALDMEREAFLRLLGKPLTIQRIKHMLETGKPLNN